MVRIVLLAALLATTTATAASAQGSWGVRGGATFDPDQAHVGAHVYAGELFTRGWFVPNVEVGFGDHVTLIAINPELVYRFARRTPSRWAFGVGGGLGVNILNWDDDDGPFDDHPHDDDLPWHGHGDGSETELGLNVLGQMARTLSGGEELFIELKVGLVDAPDAKLTLGLTFD